MILQKRTLGLIILFLLALTFVGIGWQKVFAQEPEPIYFPETGHWVTGDFLIKYESATDSSLLFGAPITESFEDPMSGRTIQYFEKARFELYPELPDELRVKITPLGEYLYQAGPTINSTTNLTACRSFVESEFQVCYAFLAFFEEHGGVPQFGYPVSGFEIHDGWIVQYFQNARFEWHPENQTGHRVTVSNLGYRYFYDRREDPTQLNPVPNNEAPDLPVFELRSYAFAASSILPINETQTLYFIVQDQFHNPVPNAEVEFVVIMPDGSTQPYNAGITNEAGIRTFEFAANSASNGFAKVLVHVTYDNGALTSQTKTSFSLR
jgi:hypothetical protein